MSYLIERPCNIGHIEKIPCVFSLKACCSSSIAICTRCGGERRDEGTIFFCHIPAIDERCRATPTRDSGCPTTPFGRSQALNHHVVCTFIYHRLLIAFVIYRFGLMHGSHADLRDAKSLLHHAIEERDMLSYQENGLCNKSTLFIPLSFVPLG